MQAMTRTFLNTKTAFDTFAVVDNRRLPLASSRMVIACTGQTFAHMPQLMQETLQSTIAAFPLSRLLHFRWILVLALVIYSTICGHCRTQIPQPLHLP